MEYSGDAVLVIYISSYVVSHPEEMVSILDDEEIVLAHDIISGGKGNVLWKRHLLKYHHLKCMVWVVVNNANRGKDGFVMLDEISEPFAPYIEQRYAAAKVNVEAAKTKPAQSRFYLRNLKSKLDGLDIDQLKYLHLLIGGIKIRLKISIFYGEKVVHLADF